jgi:two-component system sensor histidine kinase UhpB
LLQGGCIVWLLRQRAERARTVSALRDSEERFRLMAERAPVIMWSTRPDTTLEYLNRTYEEFSGRQVTMPTSRCLDIVHPDDLDHLMRTLNAAFETRTPFRTEYRLRRADGEYRWLLDTGVPKYGPDGFAGYVGCAVDITERKTSEQAVRDSEAVLHRTNRQIQDLAGRLIASHEDERAQIARRLHDDLSKHLSGLESQLRNMRQHVGTAADAPRLERELAVLEDRVSAAAENLQGVSHLLRPAALDQSGLVTALSAHCADLQHRYGVAVFFSATGDFAAADREAELCLYRVAEEALRNVVTHAQARGVEVELLADRDRLELTISDDGKGFNVARARESRRGLGLASMNERVRLAGGTVSVVTEINRGTTVHVLLSSRAVTAA